MRALAVEEAEADLPVPVAVLAEEPVPAEEVVADTAGMVVEVTVAETEAAAVHMGCSLDVPEAALAEQHWY